MCGRFSLTATPEEVQELFGLEEIENFPPRYNIAPTQPILIIAGDRRREEGDNRTDRRALLARWGFLPGWVKDPADFPLLINARSETAAEKASFRAAMRHRRVLIAASGFYEWHRPGKGAKEKSTPYWIKPRQGGIVAFGGLMETYMSADGAEMDTAAVLTVGPNREVAPIHDRMPVVIQPDDYFEAIRVSDLVNKVANSGPEVQEPGTDVPAAPEPEKPPRKPKAADPADDQMKLF